MVYMFRGNSLLLHQLQVHINNILFAVKQCNFTFWARTDFVQLSSNVTEVSVGFHPEGSDVESNVFNMILWHNRTISFLDDQVLWISFNTLWPNNLRRYQRRVLYLSFFSSPVKSINFACFFLLIMTFGERRSPKTKLWRCNRPRACSSWDRTISVPSLFKTGLALTSDSPGRRSTPWRP